MSLLRITRVWRSLPIASVLVLLLAACSSYKYAARRDPAADFSMYHTFAWLPHIDSIASTRDNVDYDDDILEGRVHAAVGRELRDRGLTRNASAPDLLLQYHVGSRIVQQVISAPAYTYYPAPYWSPAYRRAYPRYYYYGQPLMVTNALQVEHVTNGRLVVDVIDRRSGKLVWRGISTGELPEPDAFDEEVAKVLHDMFKKYP